jgi:PAS domain S-box-containing protein
MDRNPDTPSPLADELLASAILEQAQDAIIAKDLDGHIVGWNRGAEALYGYTAEEVLGKPISVLGPPGKWFEVLSLIKRVTSGDRVEHYETVRVGKDGKERRVSISLSPIRDFSGKVVGVVTIDRDITFRDLASRQIREPMPEDSGVVVIDKDLAGNIQRWSKGAEVFYGYTAEEAIGRPIAILMPADQSNEMVDLIAAIRRGERIESYATRRMTKDGRELKAWVTLLPLTDHDGRLVGIRSLATLEEPRP